MEHSTKLLGGIAYIVLFITAGLGAILSVTASIISLVAAICVAVAFVRASKELVRPDIKSCIITAVILYIIGIVILKVAGGTIMAAVLLGSGKSAVTAGVSAIIAGLTGWIVTIVSAWFWYKAASYTTEATGTRLFKTGGLVTFIGAIFIALFGLGIILMLIGQILQCIAFFQAPEKAAA